MHGDLLNNSNLVCVFAVRLEKQIRCTEVSICLFYFVLSKLFIISME